MKYLSIRWKFTIPFLLIILSVVGILLPITTTLVRQRIEEDADRRLSQQADAVAAILENAEGQALLSAQFVASLTELRFTAADEEVLERILGSRRDALQLQELSFYETGYQPGDTPTYYGGPVITRRLQVSEDTTRIRNELLMEADVTGQPLSGIAIAPQSSQIIGVAPVVANPNNTLGGMVLAVFYIDEEYVSQVSDILGTNVALVKDNAIIASTIDSESGYELLIQEGFIDSMGGISARNIAYGNNQNIRLLAHPLELDGNIQGTVLVSQPIQNLFQVTRDVQNILIIFAIIIVTIALFFWIGIVLNFIRPTDMLLEATREVSRGNFAQDIEIPIVVFRDEINELGDNFVLMSQRLQSLYDQLEDRVKERTQELEKTLRELALARDAAMEANQSKSKFLANMSHELRTPLNAIIGYSEMLQEDAVDMELPEMGTDLQKILSAARHLLQLINDILDISKIEAGKMQLYLETFAIPPMIQDIINTIQPTVKKNNNQLKVELDDTINEMQADATKVRQILFNLLSNAAKFTHDGTVLLQASRQVDDNNQDTIVFRVVDDGIGMTPEQLGRIFDAFTQADDSTTRKYGGTGLGLVISQRFCQMMGGSISVDSTPGHGSTFTVTLPVTVVKQKEIAVIPLLASPRTNLTTTSESIQPGTVLIIDDDPTIHDLLSTTLSKEGLRVISTFDGAEGIKRAQEIMPDVILLDVLMPDRNGWSILTQLKTNSQTVHIPVVIISILHDKNTGFALGASEYLTKPLERKHLLKTLEKYRLDKAVGHVLVVEDDPPTREIMRSTLQKDGWSVSEAENGRIGLQQLQNQIPEVILLDLMMPEMDGFEFVRQLRAQEKWHQIPVIVVTAKEITAEDEAQLTGNVERTLQKGAYSRDQLLHEVRQLVTNSMQ